MQAYASRTNGACAVCGERDARALSTLRLAGGEAVVVCGTHELMHRRAGRTARSIEELRSFVNERRKTVDRRNLETDELAEALTRAFSRERRAGEDRRAV